MCARLTPKERLRPISGFPEWLPEIRAIELQWIDSLRRVFESYGYCSIEPRSVEPVEVLLKQGDTDKEIYAISRLQEEEDTAPEPAYGLHYDMTVPMARYVAANMNELVFPFKRYQIQKAWRGERPQEGRFREFLQCDVDVVDTREIPLHFDAEMPVIMQEAIEAIGAGPVVTGLNNRKVLEGFYSGLGIEDTASALRIIDKRDKIGDDGVASQLKAELELGDATIKQMLALAAIRGTDPAVIDRVRGLSITTPLLEQGLDELDFVLRELQRFPQGTFVADFSIARGLAYYTGTVYETRFADYPDFPTICGGGRYDNLVGDLVNRRVPGIGISIGLTRILAKLVREGRISPGRRGPTDILVVHTRGAPYELVSRTARALRARGWRVEQYHEDRRLNAQLRYASQKDIPWIWFPPAREDGEHQVKHSQTRHQEPADPETWVPRAEAAS